ncbi:MAG TPA: hypothetical protein VNZ53_11245 [Steroidobacteraceae bacterium]|nr:hypothetical protein [Steroidobacteraceae bacterium]
MRLWNILVPYPGETGTYLGVSDRNIPQIVQRESLILNDLVGIESRAENPRVGGRTGIPATVCWLCWAYSAYFFEGGATALVLLGFGMAGSGVAASSRR